MEERGRGCHVLIITEATHWMPEGFRIPFSSVHVEVFLKWKVKKEKPKKISYLKKTFPKGWKERPVLPILASSTNLDSLALQFHRVQRDCRKSTEEQEDPVSAIFSFPRHRLTRTAEGVEKRVVGQQNRKPSLMKSTTVCFKLELRGDGVSLEVALGSLSST